MFTYTYSERDSTASMVKKAATRAEKEHLSRVAAIGCVACLNMGYEDTPAEIHHLLTGKGASQRAPHRRTIPLCPWHHRTGGFGNAIHAGIQTWESVHGTETELLEQTEELLGIAA